MHIHRLIPLLTFLAAACTTQVGGPDSSRSGVGVESPSQGAPTVGATSGAASDQLGSPYTTPTNETTRPVTTPSGVAPTVTATPIRTSSVRPRPEMAGPTGSLSGTVRELDGRGAEGVSVRIRGITAGLRYEVTLPTVGGVWLVQNAPTASSFEIVFTRGAWTTRRQVGPLGARELMVDVVAEATGSESSASSPVLLPLTERPRQPCVFPTGRPSTACTVQESTLSEFFDLQVPRTMKVGQPAHARIALRFSDYCPSPYLDRFKAVIDERNRTVRFEGASFVDTVYVGCPQAVRVTSVYMPFKLPSAGQWKVLAVLPGNENMEEMSMDVDVIE